MNDFEINKSCKDELDILEYVQHHKILHCLISNRNYCSWRPVYAYL